MKKIVIVLLLFALFSFAFAEENAEYTTLQLWSKGEAVTELQERLIDLGYLDGLADGIYGEQTQSAVAMFQEQSGMEPTGIADAGTQEALFRIKSGPNYILNTNSKKFHYPSCPSVDEMKPKNKQAFYGTRKEAIEQGYDPCGRCKP